MVRLRSPLTLSAVEVSKNISEQGPQGPLGPSSMALAGQKLSFAPKRTIFSSEMPILVLHILKASSSSWYTETQSESGFSFNSPVRNSHAQAMASSLKYEPKEKFPSISKKVW